jgi:radical SAM protein with 4Fe4S-binding SPASM domain
MDSGIVECDFCGSLREWHIGDDAMLDLIRQVKGEDGVKAYKQLKQKGTKVSTCPTCEYNGICEDDPQKGDYCPLGMDVI